MLLYSKKIMMASNFSSLKDENGNTYPLVSKVNLIGRANVCHIILKVLLF